MESSSSTFPPNKTSSKKEKKKEQQRRGAEGSWPRKKGSGGGGGGVTLEGYVEPREAVGRSKSLTEEDLEELKGCLDLGFGFSYDEIPDLCATLPALELCYSITQTFLGDHHHPSSSSSAPPPPPAVPSWKFSSPGDDPEEVKARLKYWAQAVACTVKLCS